MLLPTRIAKWPRGKNTEKMTQLNFVCMLKNHIWFFILFLSLSFYGTCRTLLLALNIWKNIESDWEEWKISTATTNHTVHQIQMKKKSPRFDNSRCFLLAMVLAIWLFLLLTICVCVYVKNHLPRVPHSTILINFLWYVLFISPSSVKSASDIFFLCVSTLSLTQKLKIVDVCFRHNTLQKVIFILFTPTYAIVLNA